MTFMRVPPSPEVVRQNVKAIDARAYEVLPPELAVIWASFPLLPDPVMELRVRVAVLESIAALMALEIDALEGR